MRSAFVLKVADLLRGWLGQSKVKPHQSMSSMDGELADSLLLSIENDQLVALAGAGLSMSSPSEIPSAISLAQICGRKYHEYTGTHLPDHLNSNIEEMANHFIDRNEFQSVFIDQLVPWDMFSSKPNSGHEAMADFLECRVLDFTVTTNVDTLIELAARKLGEGDFRATVNGQDVNRLSRRHAPLLKLHACNQLDRYNTIWSKRQFDGVAAVSRLTAFKRWLGGHLIERDIVILGYWTDWDYLNDLLIQSVSDHEPRRVIVVNPSTQDELRGKASGLWEWAIANAVDPQHLQMSAEEFLEDLRKRFSQRYIARLLESSLQTYEALTGKQFDRALDHGHDASTTDLYARRRDLCGVSANEVVRSKRPENDQMLLGAIHLILLEEGASMEGSHFVHNDTRYRVIRGSGQVLSKLKEQFSRESPNPMPADITVCAGAFDDGGARDNIVRRRRARDIIRPTTSGSWIVDRDFLHDRGIEEP